MTRTVCWFSGGVSSFVAAYLMRDEVDYLVYIDIADQHPDTMRFVRDCEQVLGLDVEIVHSTRFASVADVLAARRFVNGPYGAPCTLELKRRVREEWERRHDGTLTYVWGYDAEEQHRVNRLVAVMPEYQHRFPLVEQHLTKADAHGLLAHLGIRRPMMYDLGYPNNMGYWNRIRRDFPDVFTARAHLERQIGATCIKGVYLDELDPGRGRMDTEVLEDCGVLCQLAYQTTTEPRTAATGPTREGDKHMTAEETLGVDAEYAAKRAAAMAAHPTAWHIPATEAKPATPALEERDGPQPAASN